VGPTGSFVGSPFKAPSETPGLVTSPILNVQLELSKNFEISSPQINQPLRSQLGFQSSEPGRIPLLPQSRSFPNGYAPPFTTACLSQAGSNPLQLRCVDARPRCALRVLGPFGCFDGLTAHCCPLLCTAWLLTPTTSCNTYETALIRMERFTIYREVRSEAGMARHLSPPLLLQC
jgi:hypothetical protein